MKLKFIFILLIPILGISQQKKDWFFGAELGLNTITSNSENLEQNNNSIQGGFVAEYYLSKHWSLIGKIKYFDTGASYFVQGNNSIIFGSETRLLMFEGSVLSIPLALKWNYRLFPNLKGNLKAGLAYNFETKSNYSSINMDTNYSKNFGSFTAGLGLEYTVSPKTILYVDFDTNQFGGYKGKKYALISFNDNIYTTNNLLSFGMKHNFK
jgi:hypothetical protein